MYLDQKNLFPPFSCHPNRQVTSLSLSFTFFLSLPQWKMKKKKKKMMMMKKIERFVKKKVSNSLPAVGEFGDFNKGDNDFISPTIYSSSKREWLKIIFQNCY